MTALLRANPSLINATQAHWQKSTSVDKLANRTHLWAIDLQKSPRYLNTLKSWLSTREQDRANRIVIPYKRNYQIQSKAWLRWLLAQYTDSTAKDIDYHHGQLGKPYLDSETASIQFNATDSGNILLIAFHQSNELGLDIEAIPRKVNYQGIAKRKFTAKELDLLSLLPENQRCAAFLALWTRKEGYGKARGVGIRYPMNRVNVCDDFTNESHIVHDHSNQRWHLLQIAGENFIACLVSSQAIAGINFYSLDVDSMDLTDA